MLPRAAGAGGSSTHNLHAFVCTRPEPFRQLNGPTMDWPYILVILGIAVILYLIVSLRVLRQYERGVVFLLGKFEGVRGPGRSEEHTSGLQSRPHLVCRLLLEKKKHTSLMLIVLNKTIKQKLHSVV